MNGFDSECSSGCESGWTVYLQHSLLPPNPSRRGNCFLRDKNGGFDSHGFERNKEEDEDEEEEDLSMVSDASSGPPHLNEAHFEDDNGVSYFPPKTLTSPKKNGKRQKLNDSSILDDTASSPIFNFSIRNYGNRSSIERSLDFSQGFSATHLEGRRRLETHFGLIQSPLSGSQFQRNQLG